MGREIERRFLLKKYPNIYTHVFAKKIDQSYIELPSPRASLRIRIEGGQAVTLGFKEGEGVDREQKEKSLDDLDFGLTLFENSHHQLEKFRIVHEGWEIDIFGGVLAGLILAEKEFATQEAGANLIIPDWLGDVVEVTDSLTNLHLARLATDLRGSKVLALPQILGVLNKIPRIVITGPPCSGKTTVMNRLRDIFPEFHFVPEVATIIIGQLGLRPGNTPFTINQFQKAIYKTQRIFEDSSMQYAVAGNKKAMILDRGTADQIAYMPGGITQFAEVMGTDPIHEYSSYDAVLFLELPSREIYEANSHNNSARMEKYDEAVPLSTKLKNAWNPHPYFYESSLLTDIRSIVIDRL